jgi:hypothetical protein
MKRIKYVTPRTDLRAYVNGNRHHGDRESKDIWSTCY